MASRASEWNSHQGPTGGADEVVVVLPLERPLEMLGIPLGEQRRLNQPRLHEQRNGSVDGRHVHVPQALAPQDADQILDVKCPPWSSAARAMASRTCEFFRSLSWTTVRKCSRARPTRSPLPAPLPAFACIRAGLVHRRPSSRAHRGWPHFRMVTAQPQRKAWRSSESSSGGVHWAKPGFVERAEQRSLQYESASPVTHSQL